MKQTQTRSLYQLLNAWRAAVAGTGHPQPPAYDGPNVQLNNIVEHPAYVKSGSSFVARVRTGSNGRQSEWGN